MPDALAGKVRLRPLAKDGSDHGCKAYASDEATDTDQDTLLGSEGNVEVMNDSPTAQQLLDEVRSRIGDVSSALRR